MLLCSTSRNKMKKLILGIVFLLFSGFVYSQKNFPDSWFGEYEGNLEIYAVDSIGMQLKMKLGIHPTEKDSVYQWIITYDFKGKADVRFYELKIIDSQKGQYQIDEKNSIIIDSYYRYGILTSYFEVNKSVIIASYKKENDSIIFEIIAANSVPISETGGTTLNKDEIPTVYSYPVTGRQRAVLHKMK